MAKLPVISDETRNEIWHWYWVARLPVAEIQHAYGLPIHPPIPHFCGQAKADGVRCTDCGAQRIFRSRSEMDEPFGTIEWRDGRCRRCRLARVAQITTLYEGYFADAAQRGFGAASGRVHSSWSSYKEYLQSAHWQATRLKALHGAGNKCQVCCSGERLEVHHRTYDRLGREDPGDLTVLCHDCHDLFHRHRKMKRRAA